MADIDPYFGDEDLRRLQQAQDARVAEHRETPGAVIHARTFSSDDPEALGRDMLRARLETDGRVTLRGATDEAVAEAEARLGPSRVFRHHWDLFMADAAMIETACRPIAEAGLPDGLVRVPDDDVDDALLKQAQAFMDAQGVSPFSTDALAGRLFPARMVVLKDKGGGIAATGFAAMTHNRFSPFSGVAWVGLIAVAPALRGRAMGTYVDAISNLAALDALGASGTMEFVAADNQPSRRMLETCGLRHVTGRSVTMFSASDARLTR